MNINNIMNDLYANRVKDLPARALAEVFDSLIWCLSDNGEEIVKVQYDWLVGQDKGKVEIALEMKQVFPFPNRAQMSQVLALIMGRWPELKDKCDEAAALWNALGERLP
jgi:hypothetical protein